MKVLKTKNYIKIAYPSYDDQRGFINRDREGQGDTIFVDHFPDSQSQIKKKWKRRKKRKRKKQDTEKMPECSL